jgi:hypothetical protein
MEQIQNSPEIDFDLELRRSLILDFEALLGSFYRTAETVAVNKGLTIEDIPAVIQVPHRSKWNIIRDARTDEQGNKHFNYWLARLKENGQTGRLRRSEIVLPNRDTGEVIFYEYSQKNNFKGDFNLGDYSYLVVDDIPRLKGVLTEIETAYLLNEQRAVECLNIHRKIITTKT